LVAHYRACEDTCSARHAKAIGLLAQGHTVVAVLAITSFLPRWVEGLLTRYNVLGKAALDDLRRNNGTRPSVLKRDLLEKLKIRLREPPPDGGVWSSRKVAGFMATELGLEKLVPQRGREALKAIGWSIQPPQPKTRKRPGRRRKRLYKESSQRPLLRKQPNILTGRSRSERWTSIASG